jgi:transposase InsO family protein
MKYFRELQNQAFDVPGLGEKYFKPATMKGWLYRYRQHGFPGLVPRERSDVGKFRKIAPDKGAALIALRKDHLDLSVVKFHERAKNKALLGDPPICPATLARFLKSENLFQGKAPKPRKRFEMSRFGELWTGDFMHGPHVLERTGSKRVRKAILLAIIDDHSRLIVGARFGFQETNLPIERIFQDAILQYGIPDRLYVDNGPSFSSTYLSQVCAHLGIGLVHSKPYDSPSRGKIERFFRTVRESFLVDIASDASVTLQSLNELFSLWLRDGYHHRHHAGIDSRPLDRYQLSVTQFPRKRAAEERLAEFFMNRIERKVKNDATISVNGIIYEVPASFIGSTVEIRHSHESPHELYLYEKEERVQRVLPVDSRANGKLYRPSPSDAVIPFHQMKNKPRSDV